MSCAANKMRAKKNRQIEGRVDGAIGVGGEAMSNAESFAAAGE